MRYEIKGGMMPVVEIILEAGESINCEKGAMVWMSPNMQMQTSGGGVGKMFTRAISGESRGDYYCFGLFIYGFLVLIALITLFNIINSIAMSVVAKMKQYGVFRAIGLSNRQLAKMIIAEASTYAITGTICGSVLGIVCNKILFSKLITYKWGDAWSVPLVQLGIIIVVVAIAVILAVRNPIKKLEKTSIVDIISVQ